MNQMDGGSAFPQIESSQVGERGEYHTEVSSYGGMTLRDYFAAKAMEAHIRNVDTFFSKQGMELSCFCAYEWADSMLKARESAAPKPQPAQAPRPETGNRPFGYFGDAGGPL